MPDGLTLIIVLTLAAAVFWLTPAVLLWRLRQAIPPEWMLATGLALLLVPVAGILFAWYVVLRDWPKDSPGPGGG